MLLEEAPELMGRPPLLEEEEEEEREEEGAGESSSLFEVRDDVVFSFCNQNSNAVSFLAWEGEAVSLLACGGVICLGWAVDVDVDDDVAGAVDDAAGTGVDDGDDAAGVSLEAGRGVDVDIPWPFPAVGSGGGT